MVHFFQILLQSQNVLTLWTHFSKTGLFKNPKLWISKAKFIRSYNFDVHSKWMVPVYTFGFLSWGLNHFIKRKFWKISLFHIELTFMWVGTIKKILTHQVLLNRNLAIMLVDDSTKDKILAPKRSPRYPPTSATKLSNG